MVLPAVAVGGGAAVASEQEELSRRNAFRKKSIIGTPSQFFRRLSFHRSHSNPIPPPMPSVGNNEEKNNLMEIVEEDEILLRRSK